MSSSAEEEDSGPSVDSNNPEERVAARRNRIQHRIEVLKRYINVSDIYSDGNNFFNELVLHTVSPPQFLLNDDHVAWKVIFPTKSRICRDTVLSFWIM